MNLGADYYVIKPFNLDSFARRVRECVFNIETEEEDFTFIRSLSPEEKLQAQQKLDYEITEVIHALGVPAHIKGYVFLREAISLAVHNYDILCCITKEIISSNSI